ncbi:MAG: monooxygenase [Candidatus Liberibacter ctenarytainae]|uniref:Monooxygenase n=1 Tax=Candidatus Liberibacter ctenarytainae TaxID=2020335 RepID=A0A937ADB6_9HYPH|nr:monooxygenase [Candidatus Liberibacter ctenarytainae]
MITVPSQCSAPPPSIAIIGAGISGLTLALSLCKNGIPSHVLEKRDQLSQKGFGLQISPNASRILKKIGVLDQLEDIWFEPEEFILHSGSTLKKLSRMPCRDYARNYWKGMYGVLKRETLQKILLSTLQSQSLAQLHPSTSVTDHSLSKIYHITKQQPDLLVGADGLHSSIRKHINNQPITFSGSIVLRCIIPQNDAPEFINPHSINLFFGPDSHMVAYPLKEDNTINVVAVISKRSLNKISFLKNHQDNLNCIHKDFFLKHMIGWHKEIRQFIAQIQNASIYPLFECKCDRWHNGHNTVLIGDAAHTFLPFAAQGANMAIEDAYILSDLLRTKEITDAISTYQCIRSARIDQIYARTRLNHLFFHLRGPARICRDIALRLGASTPLSKRLDWIHHYQYPEHI